jgi:hypothetical protein
MAAKEQKASLVDPVEGAQAETEKGEQDAEIKEMSIEGLRLEDFQPLPADAAKQPHPFEGYPQQKMKVGTYREKGKKEDTPLMINKTAIIALNPKEYVPQDPSGKNLSLIVNGQETFVNYVTAHNRIVRDQNGQNITVVFDREITLADGQKLSRVAFCPDHTARAQIFFKVDKKTGKIAPDRRYLLADVEQRGRLRRVFEGYYHQQTQSERLATKFDEEPESRAQ